MRNAKSFIVMLTCLAVTGLLAACGSGTGGGDELGDATAAPTTPVAQGDPIAGQAVYESDCAQCHILQPSDPAGFAPDLAGKGDVIATKLQGSHNGVALNTTELEDVVAFANQGQIEEPGPEPTPNPDPAPAPEPDPTPIDGQALYDDVCAVCHKLGSYDTIGSPELAGKGSLVTGKIGGGHMGVSLTTQEMTALVDWIDQNSSAPAPTPEPTPAPAPEPQCGTCHALPPGDTAHAVHQALPGVGSNCAVCHPGSSDPTHNDGWVDLAVAPTYNAKSGTAAENPTGTPSCVSVSCHGGQTTPDWMTGTINVDTQCVSCHASGTGQYNSYNSGKHTKHVVDKQVACTACHNTTSLASDHFSRLDTPTMEGPASATVGGGSTRVSSYDAATQSCTTSCHGSKSW